MHAHTRAHIHVHTTHKPAYTDMPMHAMCTHAPHIPTHIHTGTHTLLPSASPPAGLHGAGTPGNATKGPERQATWMFPCKARPGHRKPRTLLPQASQRCFPASCGPLSPGLGSLPVPWHSALSGRLRGCAHASSGRRMSRKEVGQDDFISLGQADRLPPGPWPVIFSPEHVCVLVCFGLVLFTRLSYHVAVHPVSKSNGVLVVGVWCWEKLTFQDGIKEGR